MLPRAYREQALSPNNLVESHLNLARRIAWHIHGRVGKRVEIEDLLQVAYIGLMDAARRYVAQPGTPFSAYAGIRIRGALMDHLRALAGQARGTLQMQTKIRAAESRLEQSLMRRPREDEIAQALSLTAEELAHWRMEFDVHQQKSLDEVYTDQSLIFRDRAPSAEDNLAQEMLKRQLRNGVANLPEREALVLQLYYVEELNVYEIAEILKVTTGRVSQIKKAAIERLRKALAGDDDD
ncbi:sigma-70 family RNA polymerase sigma factor [Pseudotabrizicola algicola]|uniref:FliA/WhiG family RNA polymerase sigma factor n=1 Tax=Pseudotabrizicola algicola TaxID=2709381 RepID=A0A6B3RK36_9RHOB|nr:FliA/WhiG family RNA polymerase sigma factor [Pseudotabrizicola algicola]NEX45258.1 FliA/WhiG family RNA polymerase sigma factor [Pseudotabrizicola algicola]